MKKKPQIQPQQFDPERFIQDAATVVVDRPQRTSGAKTAAVGYTRTSFDLPETLYERLKVFAVRRRQPMRELVEVAITEFLDRTEV